MFLLTSKFTEATKPICFVHQQLLISCESAVRKGRSQSFTKLTDHQSTGKEQVKRLGASLFFFSEAFAELKTRERATV